MPAPNAPSTALPGNAIQNPAAFQRLTERQEMPQPSQAFAGLGKKQRFEIQKVGVLARLRFIVNLKFETTNGGTAKGVPTLLPGWPWKLIREIAIQANGVTGIIDCRGVTLKARGARVYRNPAKKVDEFPAVGALKVSEKYTVRALIEVPIAHDMLSLLGALLAQNEQTQLAVSVTWASESEVWSLGTEAGVTKIEGEIEWGTTVFSIGETVQGNQSVTVLPDLSAFHGLLDQIVPIVGSGEKQAPLIRTAGQLLAYYLAIMNGESTALSPTSWGQFQLEYGGNKKPLVWNPSYNLLDENEDEYNGALEPGGVPFICVDNEKDNPTRDLWVPEALVELRSSVTIPASVTVNSGAYLLYAQETLYPAG